MHAYIVKAGDSPTSVARKLGINYDSMMAANRGRKDLPQVVLGKDTSTGKVIASFHKDYWRQGVKVYLPSSYRRGGSVGSSQVDENDPAYVAQVNACTGAGGWWDYDNDVCNGASNPTPAVDCSSSTMADWCNPAADCYDPAACTKAGGTNSSSCNSVGMIKTVQQNLLAMGQKLPLYGADGNWGCESQKALDASGKSFQDVLGQQCAGTVPSASGCGTGVPPVITPAKKKIGEACTGGDQCEVGLVCTDGKCAQPVTTTKKTSIWPYLGIGLGLAGAVVGVAVVSGKDKKKPTEKRNPGRRMRRR